MRVDDEELDTPIPGPSTSPANMSSNEGGDGDDGDGDNGDEHESEDNENEGDKGDEMMETMNVERTAGSMRTTKATGGMVMATKFSSFRNHGAWLGLVLYE